jgi:hypothetical protein
MKPLGYHATTERTNRSQKGGFTGLGKWRENLLGCLVREPTCKGERSGEWIGGWGSRGSGKKPGHRDGGWWVPGESLTFSRPRGAMLFLLNPHLYQSHFPPHGSNRQFFLFFSLFSFFWKKKNESRFMRIPCRLYCGISSITFGRLNQSLWKSVFKSWSLCPSQRRTSQITTISLCVTHIAAR